VHPAQHRGLRELYAGARQLAAHWAALAERLPADAPARAALEAGAAQARGLLRELDELNRADGLFGFPAAQGVGGQIAGVRNGVADPFLERNQALRLAVLDVEHMTILLAYLERLAHAGDDAAQAAFCRRWERRLAAVRRRARAAAIATGDEPDAAVRPLLAGPAGRLAHSAAFAVGTAGEWIDRRVGRVLRGARR
jgi:hypothetical protein